MPMNPMQRRARNSFLLGFLLALVIMAIVVIILLQRIKSLNDAKEALEALQKDVFVATEDMESGQVINGESFYELFKKEKVQTTMDITQVISEEDFEYVDEQTGETIIKLNEDGSEKKKNLILKFNVPAGTMVTKDMFYEEGKEITNDTRLQEFNMILLPSQLKNGDYVDVRYSLPTGENYIVLAKKQVVYTTQTGIWIELTEDELLTIENAIVESYSISGSKIYALKYVEPGMQEEATPTYPVNNNTLQMIQNSPDVVQDAKDALFARYNDQGQVEQRVSHIDVLLPDRETIQSNVQSGHKSEQSTIQSDREEFVKSLEGTEKIGVSSN